MKRRDKAIHIRSQAEACRMVFQKRGLIILRGGFTLRT